MKKTFLGSKKLAAIGVAALMGGVVSGCTTITPATGNSVPLDDTDFTKDMKQHEACENYLLGFIGPFGSRDLPTAAAEGDIQAVKYVDYSFKHYLILARSCVKVYGE